MTMLAAMTISEKCSGEELARLLGITARRVAQLVAKDILKREGRDTFSTANSVQAFIGWRETVLARQYGQGDYGAARAELYKERAAKMRLEREKLEGALIPRADVAAAWSQIFTLIKTRMMAIPSKLALRLSQCKAPGETKALLDAEIREGLEDVANVEIRVARMPPRI